MEPTTTLASILPNLSIGVISVLALVYVVIIFLRKLDDRELRIRKIEEEVRLSITKQLEASSHVMMRVIDYLDRPDLRQAKRARRN